MEHPQTDRTWESRASAQKWLRRNPIEGYGVIFDLARNVYCIAPDAVIEQAQQEPVEAPAKPKRKAAPAAKAKKKATEKAAPAASKGGPTGKTAEVVRLALRKNGVSPAELLEATQWHRAPWRWMLFNPKGKGLAQRYGYQFRADRVDGEVRYYLTKG